MRRAVLQFVLLSTVGGVALFSGGCVTAHEADVKITVHGNDDRRPLDDCLLLTIRMESLETQGHWWVAQEEQGGHMIPHEASLVTVDSGDMLHQKGKVMVTIGPYVRGHTLGVEYWLYRPGYQPDDFLDEHVERAYEDKTPLDVGMLSEDSGSVLSDEKVLDGARRAVEVADFLPPDNPDGTRLFHLLLEQVRRIEKNSYKPKLRKQAKAMLPKLQTQLARFPKVKVTWKALPTPPKPEPKAKSEPKTKPAPIPEPTPQAEAPPATPCPTEPLIPTSKPTDKTPPEPEEDIPSPHMEPVPLDDQAPADEDIRRHDLKPIRKK